MEPLNRVTAAHLSTIDDSNRSMIHKEMPIRAIQFGEGNFLRAYLNWMLERMNRQQLFNGRTVAIQPTPHGKVVPKLEKQDHLYTTILQGMEDGEEVQHVEVNSTIARSINPYEDWGSLLALAEQDSIEFIFSNTTEAGLVYRQEEYPEKESPLSFPGKLAALMYRRFIHTKGDPQKGFTVIPCELVEGNGELLKSIVLRLAREWRLPLSFLKWVDEHNIFCNTLVDRIVPGYPRESAEEWQKQLGYEDILMAVGEPFHLFVIESEFPLEHKLPFQKAGLHVKWADVKPYRDLKVGLLNAPHTLLFSVGFMSGLRTVKEVMEDEVGSTYVHQVLYKDLLPRLSFDDTEKKQFADSVIERFQNPFVKHRLSDLGQNAVQKLKSRVFPLISEDEPLPRAVALSLALLLHYYKPHSIHEGHFMGIHNGEEYKVRDDQVVLDGFVDFWNADQQGKEDVRSLLMDERIWEKDLSPHTDVIFNYFEDVNQNGAKMTTKGLFEGIATKTQK